MWSTWTEEEEQVLASEPGLHLSGGRWWAGAQTIVGSGRSCNSLNFFSFLSPLG